KNKNFEIPLSLITFNDLVGDLKILSEIQLRTDNAFDTPEFENKILLKDLEMAYIMNNLKDFAYKPLLAEFEDQSRMFFNTIRTLIDERKTK
ncbi:MAG: hypothetical protein ACXAC7_22865, partial [Candidatus Hodarchaeales archaeon]